MSGGQTPTLDDARAQLAAGDPQEAARTLRWVARGPQPADAELLGIAELLAGIGQTMSLTELEQPARALQAMSGQALYDLGWGLVHVGLPAVAVPFLRRALQDHPSEKVLLGELAAALERSGQHAEVVETLAAAPQALEDFWLRYLLSLNALLSGLVETAREHHAQLVPQDRDQTAARDRVSAMLQRLDSLGSDQRDLRAWQYALNGCVLLHLSPYGFDEGMNGRYAFTQDSPEAIHRDLLRLAEILKQTGQLPQQILALPDHGSQVVGMVLAELLGLPLRPASSGAEGLVVAYDLAHCTQRPPDQPLFARVLRWRDPPGIVPHWVGLLAQTNTAPWEPGMRVGEDGQAARREASTEPPEAWARQILEASPEPDGIAPGDTQQHFEAFVARVSPRPSDQFWEGPVRSSFFG
ncbi:MAG: bacterial transcriptional activator domain-containing protein [Myxococcota bacterium]|nr:bacterial transcriptional activator domain-containing protein [Myxococcota bacterium]